ncbi:MAG: anaerobic sulfatase maturase [Bacteroidales bacterium]
MEQILSDFQLFAKPVGSTCNLNCKYCYYLSKRNLYPDTSHFIMTDDILGKYIVQHIEASTENIISFSWHGGEPLLAGIDFYRKVLRLQTAHKPAGKRIVNGIQTNGTLINEEWCRFIVQESFIIGISIDGPAEFHNKYRRTKDDSKTWHQVDRGYQLLKRHGVTPEILCVVNAENVKHPLTIYDFLKKMGAKYITFLPLVVPDSGNSTGVSTDSVPSGEFGVFLSEIFDVWVENDVGEIKIQIFEEAARTAFDQEHTLCIFKINCGRVPVVEHNGDFYSCDHYVNKDYRLGNIMDHSLNYFLESERQKAFGRAKSAMLPKFCTECEVLAMCNGECPKNRFILTPDGEAGLNYLCKGYKYFFNHCRPFIEAIAAVWKNQSGFLPHPPASFSQERRG